MEIHIGSNHYKTPKEKITNSILNIVDERIKDVGQIDLSDYAKKSELPTKVSELENNEGYITETELESKGYLTGIPSEYITEAELENKGYLTAIPSEYVTETELESKGYLTEVLSDTFQTQTGTIHSISLFPANTVYSCSDNTTSITISGFADPTPATRAAYYTIVFKATSCTFTVPSTVMWVGGNAIEFDSSTAYTYEVNFMKIQLSEGVCYLATWNRY